MRDGRRGRGCVTTIAASDFGRTRRHGVDLHSLPCSRLAQSITNRRARWERAQDIHSHGRGHGRNGEARKIALARGQGARTQ